MRQLAQPWALTQSFRRPHASRRSAGKFDACSRRGGVAYVQTAEFPRFGKLAQVLRVLQGPDREQTLEILADEPR
jgi:hypothetical protein